MKKQILKHPKKYTPKKKLPKVTGVGFDMYKWDDKGTSAAVDSATAVVNTNLHNVRQSINQKTERSEQDVKKHLNDLILPHFILTLFNTVLLILALIA